MFISFPKLTRFSHDWTITEKIDGTNAQVIIVPASDETAAAHHMSSLACVEDHLVFAGSRTRIITPDADNHGFAKWVQREARDLVQALGEGRHFGEWCGLGIQRNYGLKEKVFALFNTHRWTGVDLPDRVRVVPILAQGYMEDVGSEALRQMETLKQDGSRFAEGFGNPEGVVMRHGPSGTLFKKTYDYDELGKWAENQARKAEGV